MRADKEYCQRKFSHTKVTISHKGEIRIIGINRHIMGSIYGHMISGFKESKTNPAAYPLGVKVIGLDEASPSLQAVNWIYKKILAGKFDHLIEIKELH